MIQNLCEQAAMSKKQMQIVLCSFGRDTEYSESMQILKAYPDKTHVLIKTTEDEIEISAFNKDGEPIGCFNSSCPQESEFWIDALEKRIGYANASARPDLN
jgi:hypothetical protein